MVLVWRVWYRVPMPFHLQGDYAYQETSVAKNDGKGYHPVLAVFHKASFCDVSFVTTLHVLLTRRTFYENEFGRGLERGLFGSEEVKPGQSLGEKIPPPFADRWFVVLRFGFCLVGFATPFCTERRNVATISAWKN